MDIIEPVIIVIEAVWLLILMLRLNAYKKLFDQLTGYLAAILNNDNIIKESLTTISLYYGIEFEDLVRILERNKK